MAASESPLGSGGAVPRVWRPAAATCRHGHSPAAGAGIDAFTDGRQGATERRCLGALARGLPRRQLTPLQRKVGRGDRRLRGRRDLRLPSAPPFGHQSTERAWCAGACALEGLPWRASLFLWPNCGRFSGVLPERCGLLERALRLATGAQGPGRRLRQQPVQLADLVHLVRRLLGSERIISRDSLEPIQRFLIGGPAAGG